jgi:cation transport protein ChaC
LRIFAYGSLLWNPGFNPVEAVPGKLLGWKRRWCVESRLHRGTTDSPGVVLGLVPGAGECTGLVYTVDPDEAARVEAYLDGRELCEGGYRKAVVDVETACGPAKAITYVSEERVTSLNLDAIIASRGASGSNLDYAIRTIDALEALIGALSEAEGGLCETSLSTLRAAAGISTPDRKNHGEREAWPITTSRWTTGARRSEISNAF